MSYANNTRKFVCALNGKQSAPQLMNALGHVTAGLAGAAMGPGAGSYLDYPNEAEGFNARISTYPFIVLKSKNSGHLSRFRAEAVAAGLFTNVFTNTMIGASAEAQVEATRNARPENLEYWAVVVFGDAALIDPLTKRFSLFNVAVEPSNAT